MSHQVNIHISNWVISEDRQIHCLQQHLLDYTHKNVWSPISLLPVPFGLWTVFQSLHFSEESCKCQMIQNQTTSKSIIMEFSMRVSPMWPNAVPHICGILLVLRHLASVLWMYHITINIHNIHSILDGSMALHVIHNTEQQLLFLWTTLLQQTLCNGLECMKL